jgi:hypothetical protein
MSGFSADWLTLREPYDLAARNPTVRAAAASAVAHLSSVTIVDLACGTGATFRALAPVMPAHQHWRLVDNDLGLLARAAAIEPAPPARVAGVPVDLARDLEAALDGAVDLVTASALLDLVSVEWLERLACECAVRRLPIYAALSFDGRITFEPTEPFDAAIVAAVNAHQRRDKGFGPALGPRAPEHAIARLEALGYVVVSGPSDWAFAAADREIQYEVLSGWAAAGRELGELALGDIVGWLSRRRDLVAAGRSAISVGHVDFFARPAATR